LPAQKALVRAEADRRGWDLGRIYVDAGASGRSMRGRPALTEALEVLAEGDAGTLVVAKLDRLSRSVLDFAWILERSRVEGWALVALDLGVDTTSATGEAMANMVATFAQLERRLISERTRDALAAKRAQGVRLGRPRGVPEEIRNRISTERSSGRTLQQIANGLEESGISTGQGGRWRPGTVAYLLKATGST
jgi:DNA invertase Pin-like site-specific DNA recombinase